MESATTNHGIWQEHIDAARKAELPGTAELIETLLQSVARLTRENHELSEQMVDWVAGQTDFELAFALTRGELDKAVQKFPTWPTDPIHALNVLAEEFGELSKEVLQLTYEPDKTDFGSFKKEAIQTAAMSIRFLSSMRKYEFKPAQQHMQNL